MYKRIFLYLLAGFTIHSVHADSLNDQMKRLQNEKHPTFFRSVLNNRPRILTIKLDKKHAMAYDTWHSCLAYIWTVDNGPLLDLTGAVYNGKHGPQPTITGKIILDNKDNEFSSSLGSVHYLGHSIHDGKTILSYGIKDSSKKLIATIQETPQWDGSTLSRSVRVSPSNFGAKVNFTPSSQVKWSTQSTSFTSSNLAKPITVRTSL